MAFKPNIPVEEIGALEGTYDKILIIPSDHNASCSICNDLIKSMESLEKR